MWRGVLAMQAAVLFGLTTHASAQAGAGLDGVLEVHPDDAQCVTESALRARVQRWLKPRTIAPDVRVEVDAAARPPRFDVRRSGQSVAARSFDVLPEACSDRLDAIAIAVALAIEHASRPPGSDTTEAGATAAGEAPAAATNPPVAPTDTTQPEPAATATANEQPQPARASAAPSDDELEADRQAARAARATAHVYAGAGLWFEVLPETVPVGGLGFDLALLGPLRLDAALLVSTQTSSALQVGTKTGTLQANLFAARALACAETPLEPFALAGCGGVGGGAALASGIGFGQSSTRAAAAWLAGIARGYVRFPARGRFSLRLAAAALINVVTPKLVVSGPGGGSKAAGKFGAEGSLELLIALP